MNKRLFLYLILICFSSTFLMAQQPNRIQRGQRGYVPPPKYSTNTFIEEKDPQKETEIILAKCNEVFQLDAFQNEIIKGMLIKKFQDENVILTDKANTREDRKKKIIARNNQFYNDLSSIMTNEQINQYKVMNFEETKEDKKTRKKKKRDKKNKS
ncbi:MAG: hypothetical protein HKN54_08565 [Flavobacteriaceae bacterium]|nr:hypothetical protein [Flavobacteriaceae bacterium]